MTHRPVNAMRNIVANEDGSLLLLLHAGKAGDCVHYALVMGGNRCEGVVKDPSYKYLNGLDGPEKRVYSRDERPQFSYITEVLPDNVYVPFVRVGDCPVPITELHTEPCRPAYFILKLPDTGLPVGDTIVEVSINGRRRNYIVQRPDFAVHMHHGRDLTTRYRKLTCQPDGMFDLQQDNGSSNTADIHLMTRSIPEGAQYLVYMANSRYSITLDYEWKGRELILVKLQRGLPTGRYKCVAAWTTDNEHWTEITSGHVTITERGQDAMDVTVEPGKATDVYVGLETYGVPYGDGAETRFRAVGYAADGNGTDLDCSVEGDSLHVVIPAQGLDGQLSIVEWTCYYSTIADSWVAMAGGDLKVAEPDVYSQEN